jgi:hypothetical protein
MLLLWYFFFYKMFSPNIKKKLTKAFSFNTGAKIIQLPCDHKHDGPLNNLVVDDNSGTSFCLDYIYLLSVSAIDN